MTLLTSEEKNDLYRLNTIQDICRESEDNGGVVSFKEIWQAQSNLRKELMIEIGTRICDLE